RFLSKTPKEKAIKPISQVLMTKNEDSNIKLHLNMKIINALTEVSQGTQVIFDGNSMDYKSVIEYVRCSKKDKKLTFRILPKNSQFIIGSDSSEERGEVVLL